MIDNRAKSVLLEAASEWDKAEKTIKQAERLRSEVVIASINELRYAGRRLVDAINIAFKDSELTEAELQEIDRYIGEVRLNCLRAQHDAIDAAALFINKHIELMVEQFGYARVYHHFPNYIPLRTLMDEIDDVVTDSRGDRNGREEAYIKIHNEHLPKLITFYRELKVSEAILLDAVENEQSKDEIETERHGENIWWQKFGIVIGVIIFFAGLTLGEFFDFRGLFKETALVETINESTAGSNTTIED